MNKELLRYYMARNGMNADALSQSIGIDAGTFSRKCNGHSDFTHSEILKIAKILALTDTEIIDIFFAERVS